MSLITCGKIYEGHEWFSDDSRGRRDFLCVCLLYYANGGAKISIKSYFMGSSFFVSVFSATVKCVRQNYFHSDW